jgi:bifunctional enzyme CysN/CysC
MLRDLGTSGAAHSGANVAPASVSSISSGRIAGPALTSGERRAELGYCGATVWLTGLPGAGKSTLACELERALVHRKRVAYRLDGDLLRAELCADLGFGRADRAENVRRAAMIARWFADAGVVVLVALVSPHANARARARAEHVDAGITFLEVHIDTPLWLCERRDPKGLYRRARRGELTGLTGVDDPYERPPAPDVRLGVAPVSAWVDTVLGELSAHGVVRT